MCECEFVCVYTVWSSLNFLDPWSGSFAKFGTFSDIISLNISYALPFSSSSERSMTWMLDFVIVIVIVVIFPQISKVFFFHFLIFFFVVIVQIEYFLLSFLQVHWFFPLSPLFCYWAGQGGFWFYLGYCVERSTIPIWFFFTSLFI